MTDRSVIHDTFTLERAYPATPSRVFAAFASATAKHAWGGTSGANLEPGASITEFDFRPGGRERTSLRLRGTHYLYDALYYDVVADQRIVYSYEMYADGARISVSVATIEIAKSGDGTLLTWTEQGVYLDGIDGTRAPALRVGGTTQLLDNLQRYLTERTETKEI